MQLPHAAMIAVVDGEKFELFRNNGNEADVVLSEISTPKLDEHNRGSGTHHHSSTANPTGHLLAEDAHAAAVADWLNKQVAGNKIEHLVVIAAPRTLGELRRHYTRQLENALLAELSKDLIGHGPKEIIASLRER